VIRVPFCCSVQSETGGSHFVTSLGSIWKWSVHVPLRLELAGAAARVDRNTTAAESARMTYFNRTRVPLIFWLLSALRKFGTSRSISSKYDDSAGVFCCAL
jgi:hypothetical protein